MLTALSAKDGPRELRAAVLALRRVDKDLRRDVNARMRDTMNPVWTSTLSQHVGWAPQRVILAGARIAAGNPPSLVAAGSTRRWRAGSTLVPRDHWHALEYGSSSRAKSTYQRRSPGGGTHQVTRATKRHLRPRRRQGYVIGPTLAEVLPRTAALFVQSVVRSVMTALEEGR